MADVNNNDNTAQEVAEVDEPNPNPNPRTDDETLTRGDGAQQQVDDTADTNTGERVVIIPQFTLRDVPIEADENKWELPEKLAEFFAKYTRKHYTDSDLNAFMENYPSPTNVDCVPHLDNAVKKRLQKEGKNSAVDHDNDLALVQKKIQDVLGPWELHGRPWSFTWGTVYQTVNWTETP